MITRISIPVAAILATLLLTLVAATCARAATPTCTTGAHEVRSEDDPCWTWTKDGNGLRGVVTLHGNSLVVGPCRFARLYRTHRIAYRVRVDGRWYAQMPRLRGDVSALRAYDAGACA